MNWQELRTLFPIVKNCVYLDNATLGPISSPVADAMLQHYRLRLTHDRRDALGLDSNESARKKIATLLHTSDKEIAFCSNTSDGIFRAVYGIDFRAGNNIVIPDKEFPANVYPWLMLRQQDVEIRFISAPNDWYTIDAVIRCCDNKTKLIAVSYVNFMNGFRVDLSALSEFCYSRNIYLFLDAIQGVGVLDLNLERFNIDMLSFQSAKWLCAPCGIGIFYCSERIMDSLKPNHIGWRSVQRDDLSTLLDYELQLHNSAARYEGGGANAEAMIGLEKAVDILLDIGISQVEDRVIELSNLLSDELIHRKIEVVSNLEPKHRSGITSFRLPNAEQFVSRCKTENIIVSCRAGVVRVSPHMYNNESDIYRFLDVLDSV